MKNSTVLKPLGLDNDETLMASLLFLMTSHFRARLILSRIYNISSVNFLSITSSYIKQLISRGYDVNKYERLCKEDPAFNLAVLQERLADASCGNDPCGSGVGGEPLLHVGVRRQSIGKPCNLLIDMNHLASL